MHFHGTPITPQDRLYELAGRNFCVSYAAGYQVGVCHQIGQSVMLDNGAFTLWRRDGDKEPPFGWGGYYDWAEPWLDYQTTWAVIPDVIGGSEEENDLLLAKWFKRRLPRGAPVWHMHESLERLQRLCVGYERVCIGSSGDYATLNTPRWHRRMEEAFNHLWRDGNPGVWLHMLRGMAMSESHYPFASVDSSDVAQNHNRPQNTALGMAARWDAKQTPATWHLTGQQVELEVA